MGMTWADIDKNWGDIMASFPRRNEMVRLDDDGNWVPSGRPMIEEIICLRQSRDNKLFQYLGVQRAPQVIGLGAESQLGLGHSATPS